jgi:hypothetical protein
VFEHEELPVGREQLRDAQQRRVHVVGAAQLEDGDDRVEGVQRQVGIGHPPRLSVEVEHAAARLRDEAFTPQLRVEPVSHRRKVATDE